MKTLSQLAALSTLLVSSFAMAETNVTLDQFAKLAAKNSALLLSADTKTTKDPVHFSLSLKNKTTVATDAAPSSLFTAIRALAPKRAIESGNVTLDESYGLLTVRNGDASAPAIFDLQKDVEGVEADPADAQPGGMGGYLTSQYKVLSVVGTIVSYRTSGDTYSPGAAHPDSFDSIASVDVSKLEKSDGVTNYEAANLADLVDETSLVNALKADKFLNSKMDAKSRKQLRAARTIQDIGDVAFGGLNGSDSCYSLGIYEGKLTNFAIYDYDAAKGLVNVRVSMEASAHVCAAAAPTAFLGLAVKPRVDLEIALKEQAQKKSGLLMKDAK